MSHLYLFRVLYKNELWEVIHTRPSAYRIRREEGNMTTILWVKSAECVAVNDGDAA